MTGRGFALRWKAPRVGLPGSPDQVLRVLAVLIAGLTAGITLVGGLVVSSYRNDNPSEYGVVTASIVSYWGVGVLLTQRRPRHIAGWLLLAVAALLAAQANLGALFDAAGVSVRSAWLDHISLRSAAAVVFLGLVVIVGPLYLPDGRLPSPRWRIVPWLAATCWLTVSFSEWLLERLDDFSDFRALAADPVLRMLGALAGLALALWALFSFAFLVAMPLAAAVTRFRSTSGLERQQVKWILFAFVMMAASLTVGIAFFNSLGGTSYLPFFVSVSLLPLAIAFAVLRYGLYRIDGLISGTLVYACVTAILAGGFALIDSSLQTTSEAVFGSRSNAGVVATTLILAGAFGPLRRAVQEFVDKRLRPPAPSEDLASLRTQLGSAAQAHGPVELAAQLLDEVMMTFEARSGRISVGVAGGARIERGEASEPLAAQVSIPLEVRGVAFGVLELGARRREQRYEEADTVLLRELCSLVARAIAAYEHAHGSIHPESDRDAISRGQDLVSQ